MSECAWVQLARVSQSVSPFPFLSDHNKRLFEWNHRDAASHDSVGGCVCVAKLEGSAQTREIEPLATPIHSAEPNCKRAHAHGLCPFVPQHPNLYTHFQLRTSPDPSDDGVRSTPPFMHQKNGGTGTACSHRRTRHVAGHAAVEFE